MADPVMRSDAVWRSVSRLLDASRVRSGRGLGLWRGVRAVTLEDSKPEEAVGSRARAKSFTGVGLRRPRPKPRALHGSVPIARWVTFS